MRPSTVITKVIAKNKPRFNTDAYDLEKKAKKHAKDSLRFEPMLDSQACARGLDKSLPDHLPEEYERRRKNYETTFVLVHTLMENPDARKLIHRLMYRKHTEVVINLTGPIKGYIPRIEETEFFFELLDTYVVGPGQVLHNLGGYDLEFLADDTSYYCLDKFISFTIGLWPPDGAQEYLEKTLGTKVRDWTDDEFKRPPSPQCWSDHPYDMECDVEPWWQDGSLEALKKKIKKLFTEENQDLTLNESDPYKLEGMGHPISITAVVKFSVPE